MLEHASRSPVLTNVHQEFSICPLSNYRLPEAKSRHRIGGMPRDYYFYYALPFNMHQVLNGKLMGCRGLCAVGQSAIIECVGRSIRDGACNKSWREFAPASMGPASRVTPSRSNLEHAENLSSGNPLLQQTTSSKYAMKLHRSPVQVDEAVGGPATHALVIALASCWRWRSRCAAVSMAMSLCSDS